MQNDPYFIQLAGESEQLQVEMTAQMQKGRFCSLPFDLMIELRQGTKSIEELFGAEGDAPVDPSIVHMKNFYISTLRINEIQNKINEYIKSNCSIQEGQSQEIYKQLTNFVGHQYDGSEGSIHPESQLGLCFNALNLILNEFDDQEKFEIIIRSSETASQNSCLGNEAHVEEVEDDDDVFTGNHTTSG
jgi:hypothetical protein